MDPSQSPKSTASTSPQINSRTKSTSLCETDADIPEFREEDRKKAAMKALAKARLTIQVPPLTPQSAFSIGKASAHSTRTGKVISQVDAVVDVFRENVVRLSARGESVAALEARTESLAKSAQLFRRSSKRMRRDQQWKDMKMRIIIFFSIAVIVVLIILSIVQAVRRGENHYDMPKIVAAVSISPSMAAQTGSQTPAVPISSQIPFATDASTATTLANNDVEGGELVPQIIYEEDKASPSAHRVSRKALGFLRRHERHSWGGMERLNEVQNWNEGSPISTIVTKRGREDPRLEWQYFDCCLLDGSIL